MSLLLIVGAVACVGALLLVHRRLGTLEGLWSWLLIASGVGGGAAAVLGWIGMTMNDAPGLSFRELGRTAGFLVGAFFGFVFGLLPVLVRGVRSEFGQRLPGWPSLAAIVPCLAVAFAGAYASAVVQSNYSLLEALLATFLYGAVVASWDLVVLVRRLRPTAAGAEARRGRSPRTR